MSSVDEIILGEGVAIDSGAAPVTLRIGSGLIDLLVYGAAFVGLLYFTAPLVARSNEALAAAIVVALVVLAFVVVPASVETLTRGLSAGRLAVGLRIVRDDSGPVTARHAFGRALVGFLEIFATLGLVAVAASMVSERGKRLGDMLVGTYAMRTRGGRTMLPPVVMPYSLAEWASTADISRLPDGLALTARLFLARTATMEPATRARLGSVIGARVLEHVAPPPPPGTHPETVTAAVLATRRDREYAVALRESAADAEETARAARLPYGMEDVDN